MNGTQRLVKVFVELADTLVADFDVVDFMQGLTDHSVELLRADAAGLMLADQRGSLRLMASTVKRMHLLEVFELQVDEGPCRDCFTSGEAVVNIDMTAAQLRWPRFTPAAVAAGFQATHALPMRLHGQVIGALNLFSDEPRELSEDDITVGQAMADVATIGLLQERNLREQRLLSEQLQTALHSRVLIEQAKGVLSARAGIDVAEAFRQMRHYARRNGQTLTMVATALIEDTVSVSALADAGQLAEPQQRTGRRSRRAGRPAGGQSPITGKELARDED